MFHLCFKLNQGPKNFNECETKSQTVLELLEPGKLSCTRGVVRESVTQACGARVGRGPNPVLYVPATQPAAQRLHDPTPPYVLLHTPPCVLPAGSRSDFQSIQFISAPGIGDVVASAAMLVEHLGVCVHTVQ